MYKNYYQILGLEKTATDDDIKKAYRKLTRKYHPDANPGDREAEANFNEVNEANTVLSDAKKRTKYDELTEAWQAATESDASGDFDWSKWVVEGVDPKDMERDVKTASGFSGFFEALFGSGSFMRKGQDISRDIEISLEEAFEGTTRILRTKDNRRLEVKIPRGAKTGSKIRVKGEGGTGVGGGLNGDLYLRIHVAKHPKFELDGDNVKVKAPIDLYTAMLGGEVEVDTLKGTLRLKIPPETQNEKIFRLKGQGMPKLNKPGVFSDLYVSVSVRLPQNLSREERMLFEELRDYRW